MHRRALDSAPLQAFCRSRSPPSCDVGRQAMGASTHPSVARTRLQGPPRAEHAQQRFCALLSRAQSDSLSRAAEPLHPCSHWVCRSPRPSSCATRACPGSKPRGIYYARGVAARTGPGGEGPDLPTPGARGACGGRGRDGAPVG